MGTKQLPWYMHAAFVFVPSHVLPNADLTIRYLTLSATCFLTFLGSTTELLFFMASYRTSHKPFLILYIVSQACLVAMLVLIRRGIDCRTATHLFCTLSVIVTFFLMSISEVGVGFEGVCATILPILPLFVAFISGTPRDVFFWASVCLLDGYLSLHSQYLRFAHPLAGKEMKEQEGVRQVYILLIIL